MTIDYAAISQEVAGALASIVDVSDPGNAVGTIVRAGAEAGDGYDPTFAADGRHECHAMVSMFNAREIDGSLIRTGDFKVMVSAADLAIEPTASDTFEQGGEPFEIIRVVPMRPAGVVVYWMLHCRSA